MWTGTARRPTPNGAAGGYPRGGGGSDRGQYGGWPVRLAGAVAGGRGGDGGECLGMDRQPVVGERRTPCGSGRRLERQQWRRCLLVSRPRAPAHPHRLHRVSLRQDIMLPCIDYPWSMIARLVALALAAALAAQTPPPSPVHPVTDTLHGVAITDPYRWLEDQNSPETRAWLEAQIQYTQTFLSRIPVRDKVKQRLAQLSRIDSYGFPTERHGRYFFSRRLANENRGSICMRTGLDGKDEVLSTPPISAKTKPPPSSSPASRATGSCSPTASATAGRTRKSTASSIWKRASCSPTVCPARAISACPSRKTRAGSSIRATASPLATQ